MSRSFWSGQQVEYDLLLHLALLISAIIITIGMGPAPSSVTATAVGQIFSLLKQLVKQILSVWFWWERKKPAAEIPPSK